jgi:hypothetical protein
MNYVNPPNELVLKFSLNGLYNKRDSLKNLDTNYSRVKAQIKL